MQEHFLMSMTRSTPDHVDGIADFNLIYGLKKITPYFSFSCLPVGRNPRYKFQKKMLEIFSASFIRGGLHMNTFFENAFLSVVITLHGRYPSIILAYLTGSKGKPIENLLSYLLFGS